MMVLVEVVAALGDGERDDPRVELRADIDERREFGIPRHDLANRADELVRANAFGGYRFERIRAVLAREAFEQRYHIVADARRRERPIGGTLFDEPVQIPGLMRAVKRSDTDVQDDRCRRTGSLAF